MLTDKAINVLSNVLYVGCNILKVFPYVWDPVKFQLLPASTLHLAIFNFHRFCEHSMAVFTVYRVVTSSNWALIPDRQRVILLLWQIAHCLTFFCFLQFQTRRSEIMKFINSLWAYIIQHRGETIKTDMVSACVIFSGFIFFINGPAHGTGMIEIPCTPHFVSSVAFACRHPSEDVEGIIAKIPYFLIESYIVTMVLLIFSFNSIFVFLGLAWIRRELQKIQLTPKNNGDKMKDLDACPNGQNLEVTFTHYRTCQRINNLLNESFEFYLTWFPTFMLGLISFLLFATIKLWYIDFHAYLLFPLCSLRCVFEAMTPLAMAGKVNERSILVLDKWSHRLHQERRAKNYAWLKAFYRSCPRIVCTAGSLYTFENSIVLCTLNNSVQLTMNLLLMSNKKSSSVTNSLTNMS